jgi:biofilm PGA synthesis protein PgaD
MGHLGSRASTKMKQEDLIIELPHLQSWRQRLGSLFVSLACWSLWMYFLVPLVSLGGWLLGVRKLSAEVRWFGGYKSLIELLELYGYTILVILMVWTAWTLGRKVLRPEQPPRNRKLAPDLIPAALVANKESVMIGRELRNVTVMFDDHGIITETVKLGAAGDKA